MKMIMAKTVFTFIMVVSFSLPSFAGGGVAIKYTTSAYRDNEGIGMNRPEGIACSDNYFIVADTDNNRLLRYSYVNETLTAEASFKVAGLAYPIQLQIASDGDIFVLDGKLLKIARVGRDGTFKGFVSFTGVTSPQEVVPRSFRIGGDNNLIYVLDIFGGRVLVVDSTGNYQRHIPFPKPHGFFSDLSVNNRGDILLLDSIKGVLYIASSDATEFSPFVKDLKGEARFPSDITTDSRGTIFVVDNHGGAIVVIGQDGSVLSRQLGFGWNKSLLNYPSQICIGSENHLFVADTNNSRVQIFKLVQ